MKLQHDLAALLPRLADGDVYKFCVWYQRYAPHLPTIARVLYDRLDGEEQARFLVWFLKKWANVNLTNPVECGLYNDAVKRMREQERPPLELNGKRYGLLDCSPLGWDIELLCYDWVTAVCGMLYDQYEHGKVRLAPGDVIIDAGAFIGDTSVLFHQKLAGQCQIHSFELLDENLALMVHNLERNGVAQDQVVLNKLALADKTGEEIVMDLGAQQAAGSIFGKSEVGERIQTVTLDDYVVSLGLRKVDFIKMDIEGAEVLALKGAHRTIQLFKPRLAICLYHKWDDMFTIPQAILATGVDYDFSFRWVEMTHGWEAILFALPASPTSHHPATSVAATDHIADALDALTASVVKNFRQSEAMYRHIKRLEKAEADANDAGSESVESDRGS
jgi:FkbM family methyltransferase